MDTVITHLTLSFIVSFLLGSIPWGVIVSKLAFHKDIRDEGSGNIGTTNAFRAMGKVGGALVFVLDFGKGLLSGWLAAFVFAPAIAAVPVDAATSDGQLLLGVFGGPALNPVGLALALAFAGCTLGHIFSPWLKFKGGKGISTSFGVILVVQPYNAPWLLLAMAVALYFTRTVSVGSICAALLYLILNVFESMLTNMPMFLFSVAVVVLAIFQHRANIGRLIKHNENALDFKKIQRWKKN